MKDILLSCFLISALFLIQGCAGSKAMKRLDWHKARLSQAANTNMRPQKKLDILAETSIGVMEESLKFVMVKKSVNYVKSFSEDNKDDMEKILKDVDDWIDEMSTAEQLLFVAKMATRPYTRDLIALVPKFERKVDRKIETYLFLNKLMGILR